MALYLRLATTRLAVGGPRRQHGGAGARATTTTAHVAAAATAVSARAAAARSPYEVLRVGETAAAAEIRAAYRAMAKRAHPDAGGAGGSDGEAFLELRRAYETLSDPAARVRYDASVGVAGRLRVARERAGGRSGPARRTWETDQCW